MGPHLQYTKNYSGLQNHLSAKAKDFLINKDISM